MQQSAPPECSHKPSPASSRQPRPCGSSRRTPGTALRLDRSKELFDRVVVWAVGREEHDCNALDSEQIAQRVNVRVVDPAVDPAPTRP